MRLTVYKALAALMMPLMLLASTGFTLYVHTCNMSGASETALTARESCCSMPALDTNGSFCQSADCCSTEAMDFHLFSPLDQPTTLRTLDLQAPPLFVELVPIYPAAKLVLHGAVPPEPLPPGATQARLQVFLI